MWEAERHCCCCGGCGGRLRLHRQMARAVRAARLGSYVWSRLLPNPLSSARRPDITSPPLPLCSWPPTDHGRVHCGPPHPQGAQGLGAGGLEGACRAPGRCQGLGTQAVRPGPASGHCCADCTRGRGGGSSGGRSGWAYPCRRSGGRWCGRGRGGGSSSGRRGAHTGGYQARHRRRGHRAVFQDGASNSLPAYG